MVKRIFSVVFLVWIAVEAILWGRFVYRRQHPVESGLNLVTMYHNDVQPHTATDPILGFRSRANGDVTATLSKAGEIISRARYRSDEHGRRKTFDAHSGKKYALFFGCSYTFGNGVEDDETIPSQFARLRSDAHAYNYGFGGYGAQHMLLRLREQKLRTQVREIEGNFLYVFIDDHLRRILPPLRTYYLQKDAGLVVPTIRASENSARSFSVPTPWQDWRDYVGLSRVFREYLAKDSLDEKEAIERWLGVVHDSEAEFSRVWKSGNFWVVFFPGSNYAEKLKGPLRQSQISFLDYSTLFDKKDEAMWIPGYDHPSVQGYARVAAALARDLP